MSVLQKDFLSGVNTQDINFAHKDQTPVLQKSAIILPDEFLKQGNYSYIIFK